MYPAPWGHTTDAKHAPQEDFMSKDSQLDPKPVRAEKAHGKTTMAQSGPDGEGRNNKKQSGNRQKPGNERKSP